MDELKPSTTIRLDSSLLLSGRLQHIGPVEWIMYKPKWGIILQNFFGGTFARSGVNTVIIAGCNFPSTTIYEASERDFRIVLAQDATSQTYEKALEEMNRIGVSIMDTNKCIEWLCPQD